MTPLEQTLNSTELRAEETRWYGAASGYVAWFLHHLRCIPASMWLEAADDETYVDEARDGSPNWFLEEQADYAARRRLHDAIESMPVVARRIRQRINSDLAVFEGILPASAVQRMRRAAHLAAFALAAWPQLSREDLRRLYRPFADLIPPPRELLPE